MCIPYGLIPKLCLAPKAGGHTSLGHRLMNSTAQTNQR